MRLASLLIGAVLIVGAWAFFLYAFAYQGDNADFFATRPANVVAGVLFVAGASFAVLWALHARLAVYPDEVVVQGPFRARHIPRAAIERVWAYGRGWLRIRYAVGGQTRYLSTWVTEGYLGVRLFGHEIRSVRAAKSINELVGLSD